MAGYGSDGGFATWLTDNGYVLPTDAPSPAVLRQRGSVYVDGLYAGINGEVSGYRFVGEPTGGAAQERQWPRAGAITGTVSIADDLVPIAVINASYEAAYQVAKDPFSLSAMGSAACRIKSEEVTGAVRVEYQAASAEVFASSISPVMTVVEGMLRPYLVALGPKTMGIWSVGGVC